MTMSVTRRLDSVDWRRGGTAVGAAEHDDVLPSTFCRCLQTRAAHNVKTIQADP